MSWYVRLALRQLFPAGKRLGSSFFLFSVIGVALGVAVLVVVQSVMGGFGKVHRERIIDTSGHLDLHQWGRPFLEHQSLSERIGNRDDVLAVTAYAQGFVMVRHGPVPVFPAAYGIDLRSDPVFAIGNYLMQGELNDLYDETVLVSRSLSRQLGIGVGDEVEVFSPTMIDQLGSDEVVLPGQFAVAGIYDIEWNQEFTPGIIFSLRTMQDLYGLEGGVHGIAVRLADGVDETLVAADIQSQWARGQVDTWRERWADFLWVLDLEKTMMLFLNLFIVAVAVFAIAVAQLLMVVRKTREIGLLAAMGARRTEIPAIYCIQGLVIGTSGLFFGFGLALTLLSLRDPIIYFLAGISGTRDTLTRFYYFSYLPVDYQWTDFAVISVAAIVLSIMASLLPALRAARLDPAQSLRIEQ